jgi:ubiquinone/menaquinone biosynthesis C-methylase UbiE
MGNKILFSRKLTPLNKERVDYLIKNISEYKYLKESNILEIGIGNGRFGFLLKGQFKHYYGIDIDEEYLKIAKKSVSKGSKITYKLGSAEKIPFKRKFDIIFFAHSWYLMKDFNKVISEQNKFLESDGLLVILEPSINGKWANPKLNNSSPNFDQVLFERTKRKLNEAREFILNQKYFKVLKHPKNQEDKFSLYILKKVI